MVHVINRVIESAKFSKGIHGIRDAYEALGFEKGNQLSGCSIFSGKFEAPGPSHIMSRSKEVDIALTSLAETNFVGLLHLGELYYDGFRQFCGGSSLGSSSSDSED